MKLAINVDHVATVRQARKAKYPDPVAAAILAELGGAQGIVVHLREDRRHIQDRDVEILRQVVKTHLNLEMAMTEEMISIALRIKPDRCTLVPEKREELTTEGGLDVVSQEERVRSVVERLHGGGIEVSLFIDPDIAQVEAAHRVGSDVVELHTGIFAEAVDPQDKKAAFEALEKAARYARSLGLKVHAGHGLDYSNVLEVKKIKEIEELSIGHAVVARAVLVGMEQAVRDMIRLIEGS
ncbi:pyridoxine 5'-phosphate synthase [Thermodesulforhabdus norvegica]|uniref:Pyridoxine 5'-phosphate synthase n=1 Tax=Thermodesulforhabdus norvegica TaxID=39841 RepID=A0A1I4QNB0_9BACT|nr:pyridoxine 5'-phosphate synthase [Thermodesulforhabdus norvegica]SFM41527.1 pyridoxine 5'-phosphate synthase [Thermodesulforhabdus norvegica]